MKNSIALGYFDGVHLGHRAVIQAAVSSSRNPVVFTFKTRSNLPKFGSDNHVLIDASAKNKLLKSLGIKHIYSYDFEAVKNLSPEIFVSEILIKFLNSGIICVGYDFRFGRGGKASVEDLIRICKGHGADVIITPPVMIENEPVSSSRIRDLILKGEIKTANKLLGYELFYERKVVGGNKLGRTIGFPTINQTMPKSCITPLLGVYKSRVQIGGNTYSGITNIGVKPTAGNYKRVLAETHIIGVDEDLYGRKIKVCLLDFIRPEKKFDSFDELKNQIKIDLEIMQKYKNTI